MTTYLIGDLPGYPNPVWLYEKGIANILSLHRVGKHCSITYDNSTAGAAFVVTTPGGNVRYFRPSVQGLFYCETQEHATVLVNTVAVRREKYTDRAYKQAALARRIQDVIGHPSTRDFIRFVEGGLLRNCPVTKQDIQAAEDIFGPNVGSLQGKTVRRPGAPVPTLIQDVPYHIIKMYKDVVLLFDFKLAFLVTLSRNLRFGTGEHLLSRQVEVVSKALRDVISFYRVRGFRVKEYHADGEFESLRGELTDAGAYLNTTAEDEHTPEVERYIRTLKGRTRSDYNSVPFGGCPESW